MIRIIAVAAAALVTLPLALLAMLVALPLWVVTAFSNLVARLIEPAAEPWDRLIEFHPQIGWKPRGRLDTHGLVEDVFQVTTDADGWRGRSSLRESQIVVFGDSFAWGQGIDDAHFFGDIAGPVRIKAVGANGYSMVQELLWMRRLAPALASKLVIWFVFLGNDLYDNLVPNLYHYRRPFVRERRSAPGWEIVSAHVSPAKWTLTANWPYFERLADLCRPGFLSSRAYAACDHLIAEGAATCAAAGADLVVVSIPDRSQVCDTSSRWLATWAPQMAEVDPGYPDSRLAEICNAHGVGFLPLRSELGIEHYKRDDLHWNAAGHRRVARVIAGLHGQWVGPRSSPAERAAILAEAPPRSARHYSAAR